MSIDQSDQHDPTPTTTDDYIDMDISSSHDDYSNTEFEFHMSYNFHETLHMTSPADELFYKGNLLPLHLPPRLQMVQQLLQLPYNTTQDPTQTKPFQDNLLITNTSSTSSCQVISSTRELLDPDEYLYFCSAVDNASAADHPKNSWSNTLKLIKKSSLGQKLKASRAHLKSFLSKSGCSEYSSMPTEYLNKNIKVAKRNTLWQTESKRYQVAASTDEQKLHRQSGTWRNSLAEQVEQLPRIKTSFLSMPSSSRPSSFNSSSNTSVHSRRYDRLQLLERSRVESSVVESSIQGAIAYCKQSQLLCSEEKKKGGAEAGYCSVSCEQKQEGTEMCRG